MEKEIKNNKKQIFESEEGAKEALYEKEDAQCFDCGCNITAKEEELENGKLLQYKDENEDVFVFKCNNCFSENKGIKDYKECEVYSRIVGYLRPVQQWNDGKKQEYCERKEYKVSN